MRRSARQRTRSTTSESPIAANAKRVGVDVFAPLAEAAHRLEGDPDRERREEAGLRQRGDRLDLGVAERMILVGGLVRRANGEIGRAR